MKFSLILCTYRRPKEILKLLESVQQQTLMPDEILVIDGSDNYETRDILSKINLPQLKYFLVEAENRGLTRQRNFGISQISQASEVICFLDDDTILDPQYFNVVINTFKSDKEVVGVGGLVTNEYYWFPKGPDRNYNRLKYYEFEGYVYKEHFRNFLRNLLRINADRPSSLVPEFSHGRSCGYPMTGKCYEVDLLIGLSMSFKRDIFNSIKFSTFFEGYGLYEDADFSIRAKRFGKNIINTNAKLEHHHSPLGRPNMFKYGKMVVWNGYYVWRLKYPDPGYSNVFKWYVITIFLANVRLLSGIVGPDRKKSALEAAGRFYALVRLLFIKPKIQR